MRRLWQKKIVLLFASLFLAMELLSSMTAYAYTAVSPKSETAGMELVAETDQAALYLDRTGALLCLMDKSSGIAVKTKIMDGDSGNATMKANQKSDLIVSFYKDKKAASATIQSNYEMSIERDQVDYEKIDGGIRINYMLKEDKLTMDCVPKYISEERMNSLVRDHLTMKEKEWLEKYYRLFQGRYIRSSDSGVRQSTIQTIYKLFYETGNYTEEDLEQDNAENEYEGSWSNLEIQAVVEYVLDGKDLLVRVPMDGISANDENVIINSITLLPYFLSATSEEEGYYVVPDGTGAVIRFNNQKLNATDYVSRVYGKDVLIDTESIPAENYANMPLIGAVYKDYALLAIVENGQSMAEINTRIAGKVDNYNISYFRFHLTQMENVAAGVSSTVMVNRFTGDQLQGSIVVRYKLLTNASEVNYTGVAHAYRQYLMDQGILTSTKSKSAELYLELLGSSLESRTFLGFPYKGVRSYTSFKEAAAILEDLKEKGVDSAVVQLDGWLDGGQRHENLSSVKLESAQGSKSSFKALTETAEKLGYGLYPDVAMQYIYPSFDAFQGGSAKSYAKKYGSRFLSNQYAWDAEIAYAGFTSRFSMIWSPYILSPTYLKTYTEKAVKGLSKFNIKGLTVTDMGANLMADYNEKAMVSRESTLGKVAESMDILEQKYELVMKTPYQYAWKGVTKMSDLPTSSTEYTVFDYDIPFLQLVLDGCVSYSTVPLNYSTGKDMSELLLKCIETRSNPKFYVMNAQMDDLHYALYADYLSITYSHWADRIAQAYKEYAAFADKVTGSNIASHETLAENLVKVTYENGVIVYVNYGEKAVSADGREIAAKSYLLAE